MARIFVNLLTRDQYLWVYRFAGAAPDNVPGKHTQTFLCVPAEAVTIVVTKSHHKSTYGKALYSCEHLTREQFNAKYVTGREH